MHLSSFSASPGEKLEKSLEQRGIILPHLEQVVWSQVAHELNVSVHGNQALPYVHGLVRRYVWGNLRGRGPAVAHRYHQQVTDRFSEYQLQYGEVTHESDRIYTIIALCTHRAYEIMEEYYCSGRQLRWFGS